MITVAGADGVKVVALAAEEGLWHGRQSRDAVLAEPGRAAIDEVHLEAGPTLNMAWLDSGSSTNC